jgi:hypothetical protein
MAEATAAIIFQAGEPRIKEAQLGPNHGRYSFRQWQMPLRISSRGPHSLMIRALNTAGVAQPDRANWNGSGFMRNVIESLSVQAV